MIRRLVPVLLGLMALGRGADSISYDREVRPLLGRRCQMCHRGSTASAGIDLSNYAGVKAVSARIVPAVTGPAPRMPKGLAPLETGEVELLRRWVSQGAKNDSADERWWSLRPLPLRADSRQSIDSFLDAGRKAAGLTASPEADRRTLIRRVSLDLTGLMPTPAEVRAFEADRSPEAYANLVGRLLASPRYGERWARHWLDIAHYGDSHGYDKDKPRPNAWPYRDWVIEALNSDKP